MRKSLLAALAAVGIVLAVSGCATIRDRLLQPDVVTIRAEQVVTNDTGQVVIVPAIKSTNWVTAPNIEATANIVSQLVPAPWGGIAKILTGLGLTGFAAYWNRKNKKHELAATSTIKGVEDFRIALRSAGFLGLDDQLVKLLGQHQRDAGARDTIEKLIDTHTGYTKTVVPGSASPRAVPA